MVYMEGVCTSGILLWYYEFLTYVDWNEMFKSFFARVRIKVEVACRDPTKVSLRETN